MDENVLYRKHTALLTSALGELHIPFELHLYHDERHGLRKATSMEHFETLLFYWLLNYL